MIGEKIRSLRKARKLTQEQLAEQMHVSSQAVSKWETGTSCPDVDMLPRLAAFFRVSMDELFDFDRFQIDREVEALVAQSVPLRQDPQKAEAFYREALERYPNHEVLLNCLLMVIPDDRSAEKLEIGERLLDFTTDDEIRCDVLRLMALTCHAVGEQAMAEHYLAQLPELYFLKTEIAAAVRSGEAQMEEIGKTDDVCLRILTEMISLRETLAESEEDRERFRGLGCAMLDLFRQHPEYRGQAESLLRSF